MLFCIQKQVDGRSVGVCEGFRAAEGEALGVVKVIVAHGIRLDVEYAARLPVKLLLEML